MLQESSRYRAESERPMSAMRAPYIHAVIDRPEDASTVLRSVGRVQAGTSWLVQFMEAPSASQLGLAIRQLEARGAETIAVLLPPGAPQVCRQTGSADCDSRLFVDKRQAFTWLLGRSERICTATNSA